MLFVVSRSGSHINNTTKSAGRCLKPKALFLYFNLMSVFLFIVDLFESLGFCFSNSLNVGPKCGMLRTRSFGWECRRLCQWISVTSHPSLMPLIGVGCQRSLTHKVNQFPQYFCSFLIDANSSQVIYFSSAESVSLPLLVW